MFLKFNKTYISLELKCLNKFFIFLILYLLSLSDGINIFLDKTKIIFNQNHSYLYSIISVLLSGIVKYFKLPLFQSSTTNF